MKNYIVTITKALNKQSKVEVLATSKKQVIEILSKDFGIGIAPVNNNNIVLKSNLPNYQQSFYYPTYENGTN
jgi:hypothetical protein